jgi:hypothetical protein
MAWQIPEQPITERTPEAKRAYVQGFKAATGMAVKYEAEGKPMADLQQLADLLPEVDDGPQG